MCCCGTTELPSVCTIPKFERAVTIVTAASVNDTSGWRRLRLPTGTHVNNDRVQVTTSWHTTRAKALQNCVKAL